MSDRAASGATANRAPALPAVLTTPAFCDEGLMLGAHTRLSSRDPRDDRVHALLTAAYGETLAPTAPEAIANAAIHWQRGDLALANLHLAFCRFPKLDELAVPRLQLAEWCLEQGLTPAELLKEIGFQDDHLKHEKYGYDPSEPRNRHGHWTRPGGIETAAEDDELPVHDPGQIVDEDDHKTRFAPHHPTIGPTRPQDIPNIGLGIFANRSIAVGPTPRPSPPEQRTINTFGREDGCHTCGSKFPGTDSNNFVGDHQTPTAINPPGQPQRYYPQCITCSRRQGGYVRWYKAKQFDKVYEEVGGMEWIMSGGGPLICLGKRRSSVWGGVFRLSTHDAHAQNDYDRLERCNHWLNVVSVGDTQALILFGEGPLDTAIGRTTGGEPVIVQICYAEPDIDEAQFLRIDDEIFRHPDASIELHISDPDVVVFDSADPGEEILGGMLSFKIEPGAQTVVTKVFEPDAQIRALLHKFVARSA